MTTKIAVSYAALLTQMQGIPSTSLQVFDGLVAGTYTDAAYLFVGVDDVTHDGPVTAVSEASQTWLDLPAITKEETFVIWMTLALSSGGKSFATLTADAATYLALIEARLNPLPGSTAPDGMLGTNSAMGPLGPTGWCNVYTTGFLRLNTKNGLGLQAPIAVACRTQFYDY